MMKKVVVALALTALALASAGSARADEFDKKTSIAVSQPVEIPGRVPPAGTYDFKLADSMSVRHIVQVFTADGSQILVTLPAVPDYRLTTTDQTVITNAPIATVATTPNSSSGFGTAGVTDTARTARELPNTASALPLIALAAVGSLGLAFGVMVIRRRGTAPAR